MRGGHNKKPVAVRELAGTLRTDRLSVNGPKVEPMRRRCPEWLPEEARRAWHYIVPLLVQRGVIGDADFHALVLTVFNLSVAMEAARAIAKNGVVIGRGGQSRRNPAISIFKDSVASFLVCSSKFGLTPFDRSRMVVVVAKDEPTLGEMLERMAAEPTKKPKQFVVENHQMEDEGGEAIG